MILTSFSTKAGTLFETVKPADSYYVDGSNWKCPECGNENPNAAPTCICGKLAPQASQRRQAAAEAPAQTSSPTSRRVPLWAAALPLALPVYFFAHAAIQFSNASGAIGNHPDPSRRLTCVETYGITLNLSDQYVPEMAPGIPAANRNKSPEVSTVLSGTARNGCPENLTNVRLRFEVHDESGKKGEGTYFIESLAMGEVKQFERAWMGRVTTYDVTAER